MRRTVAIGLPVLVVLAATAVWLLPRFERTRALRAAESRWDACAIADYTWSQSAGGFMIGPGRTEIVVRQGQAVSATVAGQQRRLDSLTGHPLTVVELFSWIDAATGSDRFDAAYDARCGYPLTFSIDRSRSASDDEFGLQVLDLQPSQGA